MSTTVPATQASIPSPDGTLAGHQKSIEGLKQNVEVTHGIITPAQQTVSAGQQGLNEALYRFLHP
jgi:hypothetical protein